MKFCWKIKIYNYSLLLYNHKKKSLMLMVIGIVCPKNFWSMPWRQRPGEQRLRPILRLRERRLRQKGQRWQQKIKSWDKNSKQSRRRWRCWTRVREIRTGETNLAIEEDEEFTIFFYLNSTINLKFDKSNFVWCFSCWNALSSWLELICTNFTHLQNEKG